MKPKSLYIDIPRLFGNGEASSTFRESQGPSYCRQVDENPDLEERHESERRGKAEKCSREVHFAILAEKYQPLSEDDEISQRRKEERKIKKKQKIKKYRKNNAKYPQAMTSNGMSERP
ncbi:uncharacterized protein si:dkey-126g1.9 isoform X2 [Alosa alosa]|uniref:uncharacterized protein si:dkey-126g1.9 isoform X2 n=1 Tax=Alosa alosa TaxID=278164 RepID=UPI0020152694|nr:uncharacterized protein si:dkey-126g1.9 isoform X2 [Alosa alosa]